MQLDDDLLKGGVMTSERSAFLMRNADLAFVHEAHLASLLTAVAAIESHLRGEYPDGGSRLVDLIDSSELEPELKAELNVIRRFRNKWVHVETLWDDSPLLENPERSEKELFEMARRSLIALRNTVYSNPFI
ncbi:MAG TPA: hypothetical protein VGR14_12335 [Verrucomicrobiae bacterium]|nr:hypothetical protein [Verrucomicrobiae bacterium]